MAGGVQVWPRLVDLAVYGKSWGIDGVLSAAGLHLSMLVNKDQIGDSDLREVRAERVDPEVLRV